MASLLLIVFGIELAIRVIDAIGASAINGLLWSLLNYFPTEASKKAAEQRKLQQEFVAIRRDLNATSSQDEFAKWAKLRRTHDKLLDNLEKSIEDQIMPNVDRTLFAEKSLEASQAKFNTYLTGVRLLLTRAPHYIVPFWYAKEPIFWLPYGLFPYYAEWFLSLPRAPLGSVSIVSWQVACTIFIRLVAEFFSWVFRQYTTSRTEPSNPKKATPMPARPNADAEKVSKKES